MEFRVLGSLEAVDGAQPLRLGGPKQRAVLAMLLLHANEVVTADALVEAVWGEEPPTNARQTLQVYAANLRKVLNKNASDGAEHLSLRRGGYSVQARPDELDLDVFRQRAETGRAAHATDPRRAGSRRRRQPAQSPTARRCASPASDSEVASESALEAGASDGSTVCSPSTWPDVQASG